MMNAEECLEGCIIHIMTSLVCLTDLPLISGMPLRPAPFAALRHRQLHNEKIISEVFVIELLESRLRGGGEMS